MWVLGGIFLVFGWDFCGFWVDFLGFLGGIFLGFGWIFVGFGWDFFGFFLVFGFFGWLTVDIEGDLPLSHADPGDDGLADVLAGVRLRHRLEVQLVAVAQHLRGGDTWGHLGAPRRGHGTPQKCGGLV